jgi:trimeric autotransporter adhesin
MALQNNQATTNLLSSSVNTLTSTVNGVAVSAPLINVNSLSEASGVLTSAVNGVVATLNLTTIINTNELPNTSGSGAVSVGGIKGRAISLVLDPASPAPLIQSASGLSVGVAGRPVLEVADGDTFTPSAYNQLLKVMGSTATIADGSGLVLITLKNNQNSDAVVTGNFDGTAVAALTLSGTNTFLTAKGASIDIEWDDVEGTYLVH